MAEDALVINDVDYAGEAASEFIVLAVINCDTMQSGIAFIKDGIKKKSHITRIDVQNIVQDRVATPVDGDESAITVDARVLEPEDYMIYIPFNPRDFEEHWYASLMNPDLLDAALPKTVESALIQAVLKRHGEFIEDALWNSIKGSAGQFRYWDGLVEELLNDPDTILVANPVAITDANILATLKACKAAVPRQLKRNKNLKYIMNYSTFENYENALQALPGYNASMYQVGANPKYSGKDIVVVAGVPDNTILVCVATAGNDSNIWIGMNSKSDESKVQLARLQANSELYFIKILMKVDVNVGWTQECILYHV